ncbi:hypothetical protein ACFW04_001320 [Cataglyphis niger]
MCFPDINCNRRTNESFLIRRRVEHHTRWNILLDISNFGMITHVPLDYMHLVCIVSSISKLLIEMRPSIPVEFVCKPRELHFLSLWKATELRLFLLYTGPIILKNYIKKNIYRNFLTLYVAIRLLYSSDLLHIIYAESLLQHFVQSFIILFGSQHTSYNIHALIYLADDVRKFGSLDIFNAFQYQNYLKKIKQFLKKAERPLQRIHNRLTEMKYCSSFEKEHRKMDVCGTLNAGPILPGINGLQYLTFSKVDFTLFIYDPNNCGLNDGSMLS